MYIPLPFNITPTTDGSGVIQVNEPLDYEMHQFYRFQVIYLGIHTLFIYLTLKIHKKHFKCFLIHIHVLMLCI